MGSGWNWLKSVLNIKLLWTTAVMNNCLRCFIFTLIILSVSLFAGATSNTAVFTPWRPPSARLPVQYIGVQPSIHPFPWAPCTEGSTTSHQHVEDTNWYKVRMLVRISFQAYHHMSQFWESGCSSMQRNRTIFLWQRVSLSLLLHLPSNCHVSWMHYLLGQNNENLMLNQTLWWILRIWSSGMWHHLVRDIPMYLLLPWRWR